MVKTKQKLQDPLRGRGKSFKRIHQTNKKSKTKCRDKSLEVAFAPGSSRQGVFIWVSGVSQRVGVMPTKYKKQQEDRLLKRLNPKERRQQELLRRLILQDEQFKII